MLNCVHMSTDRIEQIKTWLTEGLLLCAILLLAIFLGIAIVVRSNALANVATLLPAEETEGFLVLSRKNSPYPSDLLGRPLSELSWLGRDIAYASLNGEWATFYEINSQNNAQTFLDSLKTEGEEYIEKENRVDCFVSLPVCFTFLDDFLVTSPLPETLQSLHNADAKLSDSADYQNVRGRIAGLRSGFVYINLQKAREELIRYASLQGIPEPGFLESIFRIFPAFGTGIRMEQTGWYLESFTAVDKNTLGGEPYFHPLVRYDQILLPYSQPFAIEWGGQDLAAQITRIQEILSAQNSTAGLIFESSLESRLTEFFGQTALTEQLTLLDEEFYFGYTPGKDFLLMVELTGEGDVQKAGQLKDRFVQNYLAKNLQTLGNGEKRAELSSITTVLKSYGNVQTYIFTTGSTPLAAFALLEDKALLAGTEETLNQTLDAYSGRQNRRSMEDFRVLLSGSDEIFILNSAFFPEESILNTLLSTFTTLASTRKLFDDGIYTRTSLLP